MSKNKVKIGITVIIILVLAVLGICGYVGYNYVQDEINGERYSSDPYTLVIEKDDFAYQIGEKLKANGIIKNDTVWNWWMDKHYPDFTYINGEYEMLPYMTYEEIAKNFKIQIFHIKAFQFAFPRDILFLILQIL